MWRDAVLVAGKDIRIEARSRVTVNQVVPFAAIVVVLFAFALDPDRGVLARVAPGLFWVAVLLASVLAVQRSSAVESADGAGDMLRLAGVDPAGVFLGKAGAIAAELVALEVVLAAAVALLYDAPLAGLPLLAAAAALATAGLAACGTVYGAVAAGLRVRETLLPMLLLPVAAPVLLAATRAWEAAMAGVPEEGWPWLRVLAVFAAIYVAFGIAGYGALVEDS